MDNPIPTGSGLMYIFINVSIGLNNDSNASKALLYLTVS